MPRCRRTTIFPCFKNVSFRKAVAGVCTTGSIHGVLNDRRNGFLKKKKKTKTKPKRRLKNVDYGGGGGGSTIGRRPYARYYTEWPRDARVRPAGAPTLYGRRTFLFCSESTGDNRGECARRITRPKFVRNNISENEIASHIWSIACRCAHTTTTTTTCT